MDNKTNTKEKTMADKKDFWTFKADLKTFQETFEVEIFALKVEMKDCCHWEIADRSGLPVGVVKQTPGSPESPESGTYEGKYLY
jgi:hypothetical protein